MFNFLTELLGALNWIEVIGVLAGILGVWLSIKEKILTWPTFIISYTAYVYLGYNAELFANMTLNIVFIFISIYGWRHWRKEQNKPNSAKSNIRHTPKKVWLYSLLAWAIGTLLIGTFLASYTNSFLPYWDAFATCTAFTAQWMLSRKYIGTWLCWLISDSVLINLWFLQGYTLTVALFASFMVLATWGWFEWKKLLSLNNSSAH
jgi:nicotinamide mononucleotide transporter